MLSSRKSATVYCFLLLFFFNPDSLGTKGSCSFISVRSGSEVRNSKFFQFFYLLVLRS